MTDEPTLPPLTPLLREVLARMATGDVVLSMHVYTHWLTNGKIDFKSKNPLKQVRGLWARGLVEIRKPTDDERKRGAYVAAYEITENGRRAWEVLQAGRAAVDTSKADPLI